MQLHDRNFLGYFIFRYDTLSPTVFRAKNYRFFFFSREESRMHIHVNSTEGESKFWMEPDIEIAYNKGLSMKALNEAYALIKEHEDEIRKCWKEHFGS